MRVLFTGEQGQLARKIAEYLGGEHVVESGAEHRRKVSRHHPWPEVDVTSFEDIEAAVLDGRPDVVVHSAAVVNTDKCAADPQRSADVNLMGTHNVLMACREVGAKLLFFSTTATYDPDDREPRPFTELSRQRPPTMYGITKYAAEMLVTGQSQVPHMVIRPCFIYGNPPFDHSSQLCRVAVHEALRQLWPAKAGPRPIVTLDPEALKDYMRVEDFAEAVLSVLNLDSWQGDVFNVSAQQARPMRQYFETLRSVMGVRELDMVWDAGADYMGDHVVNSQKLRACTGWRPERSFAEGIELLAESALKYVADCRDGKNTLLYR